MTTWKSALCAGAVAVGLGSTAAEAQIQISVGPTFGFVATTSPVYYEGRPTYWYQNHWYYRDGGRWQYYRDEPAHLREYRGRREPARTFYGRGHGRGRDSGHRGPPSRR